MSDIKFPRLFSERQKLWKETGEIENRDASLRPVKIRLLKQLQEKMDENYAALTVGGDALHSLIMDVSWALVEAYMAGQKYESEHGTYQQVWGNGGEKE